MQAPKPSLTGIVPYGSRPISQSLLNQGQIFTEPIQNKLALFAARHFGTKQLKNERIGRPRTRLIAASAASVSRRRKPPPSTNACGSSPIGAQPSSAIRSLAKLKTIEKADEKEAQRGASSLICKPPRIGTATCASLPVRAAEFDEKNIDS